MFGKIAANRQWTYCDVCDTYTKYLHDVNYRNVLTGKLITLFQLNTFLLTAD